MKKHRILALAVFALLVGLPAVAFAQGPSLTVRVLDAKKTYCSGGTPHYVAGARVTLRRNPTRGKLDYRSETTDDSGRAVFPNVAAQSYVISASKDGCSSKSSSYVMSGQNAETTIGLDDCATNANYDISASLAGEPAQPRAGGNYLLTLTVKNNGAGAPSKTSRAILMRYIWGGEYPDMSTEKQIGAQQIPSLCSGEQVYATFQDFNVPAGAYIYILKWDANPDRGVSNSHNHEPNKLAKFQ